MIAKIFSILKDEEINVDMISQVTVDDFVQIEITLDQEFQLKLNQAIMKLKDEFKQIQIYQNTLKLRLGENWWKQHQVWQLKYLMS
jgi:aspartate kinase